MKEYCQTLLGLAGQPWTVILLTDILLIGGGLLLLILIMALVLNPPEAFVKRVFRGRRHP